MIPEYKYQVKDFSIITPYFRKYVASPIIKLVPWSLPANIITLISNVFMFTALALVFIFPSQTSFLFLIIPILIFLFSLFDHLDGMQAKRTGTSSALGEFFDHYLDVFNNGILLMIVFRLFQVSNPVLLSLFFCFSYLAHAIIFYEQYKTKWLYFEAFGSLESVILICMVILASFFEPIRLFLGNHIWHNLSVIEIIFLTSLIAAMATFVKTAKRIKYFGADFYFFVIMLITSSVCLALVHQEVMIFVVITLFSGMYIGNLQRSHLTGIKLGYPNIITPFVLIFSVFIYDLYFDVFLVTYLVISTLTLATNTIWTLSKFWVWKNIPTNT